MTAPSVASEQVVLALHGFTGGPQNFSELAQRTGGQWLCPSLAGHGPDPDTSAEDFFAEVDRIAAWVKRQTADPVLLLGYSMGGRVGLALCVRHPHLVRHAIVIGAHPGLCSAEERRERQRWEGRWIELLENQGIEAFLSQWEQLPLFASQAGLDDSRRTAQRRVRRLHRASGLSHALRVLGTGVMPALWSELSALTTPVTWVVGEGDAKFRELARRAVDTSSSGRLEIATGAGHNVLLERPEFVQRLLETSLAMPAAKAPSARKSVAKTPAPKTEP